MLVKELLCRLLYCAFFVGLVHADGPVQTVTLECSADTMLHELIPGANFGGHIQVNSGSTQHPLTGGPTRTRALMGFPVGGMIPPGAHILSAKVTIKVLFVPGANDSAYGLHRMLVPWTEGSGSSNSGREALPGEPSWTWRSRPETWAAGGGKAGIDFSNAPGASVRIGQAGTFTWDSPELAGDVQEWVDHPDNNFGWMLLCASEDVPQSAKRFGSREGGAPAVLAVTYTTSAPDIHLTIAKSETGVSFSWEGGKAPFQVQASTNLTDTAWYNLGLPTSNRTAESTLALPRIFFRIAGSP